MTCSNGNSGKYEYSALSEKERLIFSNDKILLINYLFKPAETSFLSISMK